jgi:hypothetical protein
MRTTLLRIVAIGWVTANLWLAPILHYSATQPDTKLGSGLIDHSQKMTTAAMHMADMNV